MKKMKLIACIAAILMGIGIYQFLKEAGKPAEVPRTNVVTAAVNIPENTEITADMLTIQAVPLESVFPRVALDIDSVVGLATKCDILQGEQIVAEKCIRLGEIQEDLNSLAYLIKPGMRAITVSVNNLTSNEYMLKPGNRVDIITTYTRKATDAEIKEADLKIPQAAEGEAEAEIPKISETAVLLQKVEILMTGNVMSKKAAGTEYASVTFQVSPEDALLIQHEVMMGRTLRLLPRSPLDEEPLEDIVLTEGDILGIPVLDIS